jgi:hypothetical protein
MSITIAANSSRGAAFLSEPETRPARTKNIVEKGKKKDLNK